MATFFSWNGRVGRGIWWLGQFLQWGLILAAVLVVLLVMPADSQPLGKLTIYVGGLVGVVALVAGFWAQVCVTVKRFHDRGKSGWWWWFGFIPFLGPTWLLIECGFLSGEACGNDYGPPGGGSGTLGAEIETLRNGALAEVPQAASVQPVIRTVALKQRPAANGGKPVFGQRGA